MLGERQKVIGVMVHIVPVSDLARPTVTAPIMGDDAIAVTQEEHHLIVPIIRRQRPAVGKNDRLSTAPILVKYRDPVLSRNRAHLHSSSVVWAHSARM